MRAIPDLSDDEYDAIAELDPRTDEARTEFAVVYHKGGKPVAEGPFSERRHAESRARAEGGVIAERTVNTDFGLWAPSDPAGH